MKCYPYIPIVGETVDICPKRFDMNFLSNGIGNYDYNEGDAGYCSVGWYIAPLKSIAICPKDYLIGDIQPCLNQEDILKSIYPMEVIGNIHDNPNLLKIEHDSLCETETYKAGDEE